MKNIVILGSQWGDEGKGKMVDWLSENASAVVRFQGGHNAGHTIIVNGHKVVLRLLPSGMLHSSNKPIKCYLGNGVVLSLEALLAEIQELKQLMGDKVSIESSLGISLSCPVIMPYHVLLDNARELRKEQNNDTKIGTTGRGIGPCYEDKVARRAIRVGDLYHEKTLMNKLRENTDYYNFLLKNYYNYKQLADFNDIYETTLIHAATIKPLVCDVASAIFALQQQGKKIIFEGAQGTLLDIDFGTYPFVTSSNCVAGAVTTGAGASPKSIDYILGVAKSYTTRVGGGPFPTELHDDIGDYLATTGKEFGSVTGRKRRCGWLDVVALKRAIQINGIDGLCITKLDVLDGLREVKLCVAYLDKHGNKHEVLPLDANLINTCTPIYESMPGWQEKTCGVSSYDELPEAAKNYLKRITDLTNSSIDIISTGADRKETIVANWQLDFLKE